MSYILLNKRNRPAGGHRLIRETVGESAAMFARFWDLHDSDNAPHRWHDINKKPQEVGLCEQTTLFQSDDLTS